MTSGSGPISVALTGASGVHYALKVLECLIGAQIEVYVMVSKAARAVLTWEADIQLPSQTRAAASYFSQRFGARDGQVRMFGSEEWTAPVASGSSAPRAMVICPCSMGTLAAVATGSSQNLIARAADVAIKEKRQLIVVPRETPFSVIHLRNMMTLAELGVVVLPANPGYYGRPRQVQDLIDFVAARILDHLGVEHGLGPRWATPPAASSLAD
jgi:flavin prenyltransferase